MSESKKDERADIPTGSDKLAGDTQRSEQEVKEKKPASKDDPTSREEPNPPHTTTGIFTAPKFGAAGSGGLEIEPGLEKD
jgi:hypothetical protein